jgi:peptide/nickel transport system substrate-binding protein
VHAHDLGIAIGAWRASWPDGYGFLDELANGNATAQDGGTVNISEINDPAVNSLFAVAAGDDDAATRAAIWPYVDRKISYGMYNYALLGVR